MNERVPARRAFLGRTPDGIRVYVDIRLYLRDNTAETVDHELIDGYEELSISVDSYTGKSGFRDSQEHAFGQCIDLAAEVLHGTPAPGVELNDIRRLVEIWRRWHLNGMNAGCAHQEAVYEDSGYGRRPSLDLTPECPVTGYRYGRAWLVDPLPAEVRDEVMGIAGRLAW